MAVEANVGAGPGEVESPPPPLGDRILKWLFRASVAGLALSLFVHLLLLAIAALIMVNRPVAGAGQGAVGAVELSVVTEAELTQLADDSLRDQPLSMADLAQADPAPQSQLHAPISEPGLEAHELGGSPLGGVGSMANGADGQGLELAGGAGGSASFFGIEARGARFVYIVDVSASMGGPKMDALRRELTGSINRLERASFEVFFFSSETRPIGGQIRWLEASAKYKQFAAQEIKAIDAFGGTNPMPAFVAAFAMTPRPDAIYFMTDGLFSEAVVGAVAELNRQGAKIPVHCISFLSREAEALLRAIAKQSGGTYSYVGDPNL